MEKICIKDVLNIFFYYKWQVFLINNVFEIDLIGKFK